MTGEPTWLYRFWGDQGVLLYVGITKDLTARTAQHQADKPWFRLVRDCTIEMFDGRPEALLAEREAITTEFPLFNLQHADQRQATAWMRLLTRMLIDDGWPVQAQRLPAIVRLATIEPGFTEVINGLWSVLECADDFCGDCVWEGGGVLSGSVKAKVQGLFGYHAANPLAQHPSTYELAISVAYECLPRAVCTYHADVVPYDRKVMHRARYTFDDVEYDELVGA